MAKQTTVKVINNNTDLDNIEQTNYVLSIHQSKPVDRRFVEIVQAIEKKLKVPVWLFIQRNDEDEDFGEMSHRIRREFRLAKPSLPKNKRIALIIDSPGGYAQCAYQLAKLFRNYCGGFIAVIPRYAKSAATLLTLGADVIIINDGAELGPLDTQILDYDREDYSSALDEVQTLERLHAFSLDALDKTVFFLVRRTKKKVETILPQAMRFVTETMRPLYDKVDVVHYTQRARTLKVAEEYAVRLLKPKYTEEQAKTIARHLVENYPEHAFVIDKDELESIGLETANSDAEMVDLMNELILHIDNANFIGQLKEEKNDEQNTAQQQTAKN